MKHVKRWILFFSVSLGFYIIFKLFLLSAIVEWFTVYVKLDIINTSDILSVVSGVVSLTVGFISDYYFKRREERINIQQEAPYINLRASREPSVTGKRSIRNDHYIQIELGKQQQEFRYVYSQIINAGKSTIVNCFIAKKHITQQIKPQEEYDICFLVYEPIKTRPKRKYSIKYQIEDGKGNEYIGTYILRIDTDKHEASFHIKKKQKEL